MLNPSIDSLLTKVPSKYLLVTVASKRAREMQYTHEYQLDSYTTKKNVGKALEEIEAGVLKLADSESEVANQIEVKE